LKADKTQPGPDVLKELIGLEKHYGFKEYHAMVEQRTLKPGQIIMIPRFYNEEQHATVIRYIVEDKDTISPPKRRARQTLQGLEWYVQKTEIVI